jgi:hypothetical protein
MTNYNPDMTLSDILETEGIVVRKIPLVTRMNRGDGTSEVKDNSLGGKYLVTLKHDQFSTVRFDKGFCGIGCTVQEAWRDLVLNRSYYLP